MIVIEQPPSQPPQPPIPMKFIVTVQFSLSDLNDLAGLIWFAKWAGGEVVNVHEVGKSQGCDSPANHSAA